MAFPGRERSVDEDGAKGNGEARPEAFQAGLDRTRNVNGLVDERKKVDERVVPHASYESDNVGHCNDPLACKKLTRDHRDFGDLPFPEHKGCHERKANDECTQNVGA